MCYITPLQPPFNIHTHAHTHTHTHTHPPHTHSHTTHTHTNTRNILVHRSMLHCKLWPTTWTLERSWSGKDFWGQKEGRKSDSQSWYSQVPLRLNVACCMWWLRIAWLGSVAKTVNFHSYGTSRDQREAQQTLSVTVREAVYHKFMLRNHYTQHAMFKRNGNQLYVCVCTSPLLDYVMVMSWWCHDDVTRYNYSVTMVITLVTWVVRKAAVV